MDFSDFFILRVETPSGFAHFVLSSRYLRFFDIMQQNFDRARFVKFCKFIRAMSGSYIFDDKILSVTCFSISNCN